MIPARLKRAPLVARILRVARERPSWLPAFPHALAPSPAMRNLLLIVLLLGSGVCSAKKMQMDIASVILSADLIVVGEITSNGMGSYTFNIEETPTRPRLQRGR